MRAQPFHHSWLYSGSGNANFYYAIGLVFVMAQAKRPERLRH